MNDAEPQFHPAVEKVLDTKGPDIGRVKKKDLAYDLAQDQDQHETYGDESDPVEVVLVDPIKKEIAREAVAGSFTADVIAEKAVYDPNKEAMTNESKVWLLNSAREEAAKAVKSADKLLKVSKPANDAQELARSKEQLAAARLKIADLEAGKQ